MTIKRKARSRFRWGLIRVLALLAVGGIALYLLEAGNKDAARIFGYLFILLICTYL